MSLTRRRTQPYHDPSLIEVDRRIVGQFADDPDTGTPTMFKSVKSSNYLRYLHAWAISAEHLQRAIDWPVSVIQLRDEHGTTYTTKLATFIEHAERFQHDGFEPQFALNERFWERHDPRQMAFDFDLGVA